MEPLQLTTPEEAVSRIPDGATVSFNGIGMIGLPELFFPAIEKRFLSTGHPRGMTLYSACGLGSAGRSEMRCIDHPGMFSCMIVGYIFPYAEFMPAIMAGRMEGYNLPQGIISVNYREAAAGRPGFLSKVGLNTFSDPRREGCRLGPSSHRNLVELMSLDGEEYLFYRTVRPDVCILRGTCADPGGNITMENEVNIADALAIAMATHNNGGRVLVQVERLRDTPADPKSVVIPGAFVTDLWVHPEQMQTNLPGSNDCYTGKKRADGKALREICREALSSDRRPGKGISAAERIIIRRAALELKESRIVNLGIGMPMLAACEAYEMGLLTPEHHLTLETGVLGGIPVPSAFGAVVNPEAIYPMASQFDLYEGGGLDAAFVGAIETDRHGNVNVIRKGNMLFGAGGFQHVTIAARKIVVCSKFRISSGYAEKDGRIELVEGRGDKFVDEVECIAMNAAEYRAMGKRVIYITERAVFELDDDGLVMTEVAPGLHPYFNVLDRIPFPVRVHPRLRPMPSVCFALSPEADA